MKPTPSTRLSHSPAGLILLALLIAPATAHAHVVPGASHSVLSGLAHPLLGLDHLLAMVAVGLLAAQAGGRALWVLPAVFVGVMSVGGVLGAAGPQLPFVEPIILLSLFVFGSMIAFAKGANLGAAAAMAGLFALFHGHVHGAELASTASLAFLPGMLLATALLHGAGIALALGARAISRTEWIRLAGGGIVACGFAIALGLF